MIDYKKHGIGQREIKFRGWGNNSEEFIDEGRGFPLKAFGSFESHEDWTFTQFTGLKDKNGKEIYEGDIVDVNLDEEDVQGISYHAKGERVVIKFNEGAFCYSFSGGRQVFSLDDLGDKIRKGIEGEIIGNIFESPELIEKNETI